MNKTVDIALLLWFLSAMTGYLSYVFFGLAWWEHWGYETGTVRSQAVFTYNLFGLVIPGFRVLFSWPW